MRINQNKSYLYAVIFGISFGLADSLLMLPLQFENKVLAISSAFLQRFAIGFLIPFVSLPVSGILKGIIISLLISFPTALITGSYGPILITGIIGGAIIGKLSTKK